MKILSAAQIREWDRATIERQGISSLSLMERAAEACVRWLTGRYQPDTPFLAVCGTGNNGGDGLAITRLLMARGYAAKAFLVGNTESLSPDCSANLEALRVAGNDAVNVLAEGDFITELPQEIVILDALFGTGLNRKPEGYAAAFITQLNKLSNKKIAIDLPSGMFADTPPDEDAAMVKASCTLTFQQYKRAMLHPESGAACGELFVVDIGLDKTFAAEADTHWFTADRAFIKSFFRPRPVFTHKGMHGTALVVGGSYGLMGAAVLAAKAAGRAGAGKVRGLLPECGYTIFQSLSPEAMCATSGKHFLDSIEGWEAADGIGIGPGMGTEPATVAALAAFLGKLDRPVVLDADALNMLGAQRDLIKLIPPKSVLTPHPKELERMFGKTRNTFERAEQVRSLAMQHDLVIVAKDTYSIVALPDGRCFYNIYGNSGLATGGSGDVLLGVITGLLAQGYSPEDAALLGVYLHATAGDIAAKAIARESMIAGDVVASLPQAFLTLY